MCSFNILQGPEATTAGREGPDHTHSNPQGPPFSIKCWLATGSPPEAHKQSHKDHTAFTKPKCTQFHHDCCTTPPTQELTLFPVWAEQHHLLTTTPTSHLRCLSSGPTVRTITLSLGYQTLHWYPRLNHTGVVCLVKCHGLTFDLLPRPPRHLAGVRGHMHTGRGTRPPIITSRLHARCGPANATLNQQPEAIKTALKLARTRTHTARMTWDTPTS